MRSDTARPCTAIARPKCFAFSKENISMKWMEGDFVLSWETW